MKMITILTMTLIMISYIRYGNSTNETIAVETAEKKDTLLYFWQADYNIYSFDTVINHTYYRMETYCLNDSAVYNETFSEVRSKNKNLIEFSVAHNYATDFTIKTDN